MLLKLYIGLLHLSFNQSILEALLGVVFESRKFLFTWSKVIVVFRFHFTFKHIDS